MDKIGADHTSRSIADRLSRSWIGPEEYLPAGNGLCLDLGCADERHRAMIEACGYQWIGMDLSFSGRVKIVADAHYVPFSDKSFRLVFMWGCLQEMKRPWIIVQEVARILQPGGYLYGSTSYLEPNYGHIRFAFSDLGLRELLADNGFEDVQLHPGVSFFPIAMRRFGIHLLGLSRKNRLFLNLGRLLVRCMVSTYILFRSMLRNAARSSAIHWLSERAPFDFAAQIVFIARKN